MDIYEGLDAEIAKPKTAEMKRNIICLNGLIGLATMVLAARHIGECIGVDRVWTFALNTTAFAVGVSLYIYFLFKG